jgi:hypothetical protein
VGRDDLDTRSEVSSSSSTKSSRKSSSRPSVSSESSSSHSSSPSVSGNNFQIFLVQTFIHTPSTDKEDDGDDEARGGTHKRKRKSPKTQIDNKGNSFSFHL